ncbi:MAG: hypothetical protein A2X61_13615 [Ignavibacteria bacterium GWB2_35_12]|nr:MAG: hypothetical protein A2X61_13615 [Ignavibacteria bacterium GWB2_35_12]OGU95203.1 MAG: hypothetical protein A2220_00295 [Ignavibacteria bacterium RIFOXYA2_FULL_35_10]OGV24505.1 MAG: hypothetical protein A2475_15480 [Ignavibacteria bacterium RIFOXYC2_FULL_35_21]
MRRIQIYFLYFSISILRIVWDDNNYVEKIKMRFVNVILNLVQNPFRGNVNRFFTHPLIPSREGKQPPPPFDKGEHKNVY